MFEYLVEIFRKAAQRCELEARRPRARQLDRDMPEKRGGRFGDRERGGIEIDCRSLGQKVCGAGTGPSDADVAMARVADEARVR